VQAETLANEHKIKSLEIYRSIIEIPTVAGRNNGQRIVDYLSEELEQNGFASEDIHEVKHEDAVAVTVRYRGKTDSELRPILLLGHLDVVEAHESDWQRPPFELTEDEDFYYARGSIDNKYGVAMLTSTFIKLKAQGFVPNRDLYLVFSGDEETTMATTEILAYKTPYIKNAAFALNSDVGGGSLDTHGRPIAFNVQAAEKTYATFDVVVSNPGGHSSLPRQDNAIYDLAEAINKLKGYEFEVKHSSVNQAFFAQSSHNASGDLKAAMLDFANDHTNQKAIATLSQYPEYNSLIRTTCTPTMLEAGHAENALPQTASLTINCRIFPGESVDAVKKTLEDELQNPNMAFRLWHRYPESPVSELDNEVQQAVRLAVDGIYKDLPIVPYMSSGATDAMHFRSAGIPTWGISGAFMRAEDMFAHGLDERLPKKAFKDALDFWTVLLTEIASD